MTLTPRKVKLVFTIYKAPQVIIANKNHTYEIDRKL